MTGGNWYSLHRTVPHPMNMVKGVSLAFVQVKEARKAPAWPAPASKPIISKHLDTSVKHLIFWIRHGQEKHSPLAFFSVAMTRI